MRNWFRRKLGRPGVRLAADGERLTSSTRNILIGLGLGLLGGLFLGEKAEVFQFVVRAYLGLLQMTVLP